MHFEFPLNIILLKLNKTISGLFYVAVSRVKNEYALFIRNFDCKQIVCNEEYSKEMEDLQTNRKYEYVNTYLKDKIFIDDKSEVKLGYLNINGLKNKVEDIDEDKNLLNLDCLVLSETKLGKETELNFQNWNVERFDLDDTNSKTPHMGMAFLTNKNLKFKFESSKASSIIKLSGGKQFQYISVRIPTHNLAGIFFYINKKPLKKDVEKIVKQLKDKGDQFLIGDLNLDFNLQEDRQKLELMCTGLDVESILYQNTRFSSQLDHILVSNKLKLQAFASSFANLYTDHSSVTVRICKNGNFTSEFVEDQVRKQGLNYLIQKDANQGKETRNKEETTEKNLSDDVLMKGNNFLLHESELYRLNPPHFLSDDIINAYLALVSEKYSNIFIFDTCFHTTLEENGFNSSRSYVKHNPFKTNKWLIPVNFQNCHWILLHANIENISLGKVVLDIYDSAIDMDCEYDIEVEEIRKYIIFMHEKYLQSKISKLNIVLRNVSNTLPQQQNRYDCGAFLLGYALCLSGMKEIQFTQVNIDQFRPNLKHAFRRKKLDSNCSLFSPISEDNPTTPEKGHRQRPKVDRFKQDKKQKKEAYDKDGDNDMDGHPEKSTDIMPAKFSNDGTLCWLNSLIQLLSLIYTQKKGSFFLKMILDFKMSSKLQDASFFREMFSKYDRTLR